MIEAKTKGGREVARNLGKIPAKVHAGLVKGIGRLTLKLQRKVKMEKLTGQVLNVKTGTLRRSIDQRVIQRPDGSITGIVATNVKYAGVHEFGFKGRISQSVREHLRKNRGKRGKHKVRAHTRNRDVDLPERSFLRSALREMTPEINNTINDIISGAIK
jgi:phage gpG-like protein